jgi:Protein of unknown function (DUF3108)
MRMTRRKKQTIFESQTRKLFQARSKINFGLVVLAITAYPGIFQSSSQLTKAASGAAQSVKRRIAKPKNVPQTAKEQPMPFQAGEILNYRVSWSAFSNAASVQLSVPERRDLFGSETWHFRAAAHTLGPVRTLFPLDDQFDSYTDSASLESRQFEMHLSEMGKVDDQVLHLASSDPSHSPKPAVVVPAGTRDPLGTLYVLRPMDWQHAPDFRAPVYDGHDVFEMRARCDVAGEAVKVAAGNFSAARISIHVFQYGKEVSAIRFEIWIANDAARTPVLIEANLPFGSLRAELVHAQQ